MAPTNFPFLSTTSLISYHDSSEHLRPNSRYVFLKLEDHCLIIVICVMEACHVDMLLVEAVHVPVSPRTPKAAPFIVDSAVIGLRLCDRH